MGVSHGTQGPGRNRWAGALMFGRKKEPVAPLVLDPCWKEHDPKFLRGLRLSLGRMGRAEALLTILTGAVTADNETDAREQKAVDAILMRSPTLRKLSTDQLEKLATKIGKQGFKDDKGMSRTQRKANNKKRWRTLEKARRTFIHQKERPLSVYLQALDVLYADQTLLDSEKIFRAELAEMLDVVEQAERFNELIAAKNDIEAGGLAKEQEMAGDQKIDAVRHAFYTILAGAVMADGEEKASERIELEAITMRVRILSHLNEPSRHKLRTEVAPGIKKNFEVNHTRWDRVNEACTTLKSADAEIRRSAYLHAVDLSFADGELSPLEEDYLEHLREQLAVHDVDDALEAFRIKNEVKPMKRKRAAKKRAPHGALRAAPA